MGVLVGLWPRFGSVLVLLFALFLRWRNASLAGGFAGRRFFWLFLWFCVGLIDVPNPMDLRPCTIFFYAYAHIRTEPLVRHRPNSRKKNSIGTSIVALRLTCARLHFHVSGASKPRAASNASAGNSGWSFIGSTSACAEPRLKTLMTDLVPVQ